MSEKDYAELKAENDRLKEEVETRDNLVEHFRKESLSWANIANEYQKDKTKLEQTLQEIKDVAEEWMKDYCYLDNFKDEEGCSICHENKDCYSYRLLKALTKAEEE